MQEQKSLIVTCLTRSVLLRPTDWTIKPVVYSEISRRSRFTFT